MKPGQMNCLSSEARIHRSRPYAWNAEKGGAEFVHVDLIHTFLKTRFARAGLVVDSDYAEIKLFITLLGLSGTDFKD